MARAKKRSNMSRSGIASLPAAAGAAVLSSAGRGAIWTLVKAFQAPFSSAVAVAMTVGTLFAASNALYMQTSLHPAPFFDEAPLVTASIAPASNSVQLQTRPVMQTHQVSPRSAPIPALPEALAKIGRSEVMTLQKKLTRLGLFEGKADGFYGPQTADAIRTFESQSGLRVVGALTPEIYNAVLKAKQPTTSKVKTIPVTPSIKLTRPDPLAQITRGIADIVEPKPSPNRVTTNKQMIQKVQVGLASLGFLQGKIDGVAGEATAKAIRNFEVYYNYKVTGAVTPELVDMLSNAGAQG